MLIISPMFESLSFWKLDFRFEFSVYGFWIRVFVLHLGFYGVDLSFVEIDVGYCP